MDVSSRVPLFLLQGEALVDEAEGRFGSLGAVSA